MERQAGLARDGSHGIQAILRPDGAAGEVVGVLGPDECGLRTVRDGGTDRPFHIRGVHDTVDTLEREEADPRERLRRTGLEQHDVRVPLEDDLGSGGTPATDGDLVGHRPARDEQRLLLAEHLRDALLQPLDGRVVPEDVVTHLGRGDRLAHGRPGPGHGVGAEIDRMHGIASGLSRGG